MNKPVFYTEIFCALVVLVIFIGVIIDTKKFKKTDEYYKSNLLFITLCIYAFLVMVIDAMSYSSFISGLGNNTRVIITLVTYIGPLLICAVFLIYLYEHFSVQYKMRKILFRIGAIYCIAQSFFCVYYSVNGKIFYFDDEGYYQIGEYYNGYMLVFVVLLVYALFVILIHSRTIGTANTIISFLFVVIPQACIIINIFDEDFEFSIASNSLSLLILYVMMQKTTTDKLEAEKTRSIEKSHTDELTQIGNRTYYEEVCVGFGTEEPVGIVFADLNCLKYMNDNYGHSSGDNMLVDFANVLKNNYGSKNVFRISGDEFVVLERNCDKKVFENKVKQFTQIIMSDAIPMAAIGSAYGKQSEFKELVASAESKMYDMKKVFYKEHPEYIRKSITEFKDYNANSTSADFSKDELFNWAFKERVTGHYNWNWMREKLEHFDSYGISDYIYIHFDVKDFKMVNELYSHVIADNLLKKICRKLNELDWIFYSCRCDNDNFAIMAKKMSNEAIEAKIKQFFNELSYLDEDNSYKIYFRCGVANITDINNYRVVIADMAKMAHKLGTKVNETEIHFYTDEMKEDQIKSKKIKQDLPNAIANHEFEVYYQPKYDPTNDSVIGAEALIRWNKDGKVLSPGAFIPYLEKEAVIEDVDLYVLEEVCRFLEEYEGKKGNRVVPISVNMSKVQVYNPSSLSKILTIINRYNVDRKLIEFELTETLAYNDEKYLIEFMYKLRKEGFGLSMDDFGTGFSSLNLLSKMPLTTLKIDKSFIDKLLENENDKTQNIVKDIIAMTQHLCIKSIAEGVEKEDQRDMLKEWGCNGIQGYFYSKPIRAGEFKKLLKA